MRFKGNLCAWFLCFHLDMNDRLNLVEAYLRSLERNKVKINCAAYETSESEERKEKDQKEEKGKRKGHVYA